MIVSADLAAFSPNGDGSKDRVAIIPQLRRATDIESYELRIIDASGRPVRTVAGRAPARFDWDGRTDSGRTGGRRPLHRRALGPLLQRQPSLGADDALCDRHGIPAGRAFGRQAPVLAGQGRPRGRGADQPEIQHGDPLGRRDPARERRRRAQLLLERGGWRLCVGWDRRARQRRCPTARYTYAARATDQAGNSAERRLEGIVVDRRPTPVFVTAAAAGLLAQRRRPAGQPLAGPLREPGAGHRELGAGPAPPRARAGQDLQRRGERARSGHLGRRRRPRRALHRPLPCAVRQGQPPGGRHRPVPPRCVAAQGRPQGGAAALLSRQRRCRRRAEDRSRCHRRFADRGLGPRGPRPDRKGVQALVGHRQARRRDHLGRSVAGRRARAGSGGLPRPARGDGRARQPRDGASR